MALQLSSDNAIRLGMIIDRSAMRLARAHVAYAENKFRNRHRKNAYLIRNAMCSMLAEMEDKTYGTLASSEGEHYRTSMRRLEMAASALIAAITMQDGVRGALDRAA